MLTWDVVLYPAQGIGELEGEGVSVYLCKCRATINSCRCCVIIISTQWPEILSQQHLWLAAGAHHRWLILNLLVLHAPCAYNCPAMSLDYRSQAWKCPKCRHRRLIFVQLFRAQSACIHSQNTCYVSMFETYYLNFIASKRNPQKSLKCSGFVKTRTELIMSLRAANCLDL